MSVSIIKKTGVMTIKLNDKVYEIEEGTTLSSFIESLEIGVKGIAIAINYEVVPKARWSEVVLSDNQELMLIQAVSGG